MLLGLLLGRMICAGVLPWTAEQLHIATSVGLMKGHLISALEDYKLGRILCLPKREI
jgi:hypothetical protein